MKLVKSFIASSFFLPVLALAQTPTVIPGQGNTNFTPVFNTVTALGRVTTALVMIAMTAVLLLFFWGVAKYITAGADEEKKAAARSLMIYGVIGVFVVFSIWGLVGLLGRLFGVGQGGSAPKVGIPGIDTGFFGGGTN